MVHLNKYGEKLEKLIFGINPINKKSRLDEISGVLDKFLPAAEKMQRNLKRYQTAFKELEAENTALEKKNKELSDKSKESLLKKLEIAQLKKDYAAAIELIENIPKDIMESLINDREAKKKHLTEHNNRNGGRDI